MAGDRHAACLIGEHRPSKRLNARFNQGSFSSGGGSEVDGLVKPNDSATRTHTVSRRHCLASVAVGAALTATAGCARRPSPVPPAPEPTTQPQATARREPVPTLAALAHATPTAIPPTSTPVPHRAIFWSSDSSPDWLRALEHAASAFRARNPTFTVQVSGGHADFGKVLGSFASDQVPDVFDPGASNPYVNRGILRSLDTRMPGSEIRPENYPEVMWQSCQWNGRIYGIPALDHGSELGLIINRSQVGDSIAVPSGSWDALLSFGRLTTLYNPDGTIRTLGFDPLDGVGTLLDTARDLTGQEWLNESADQVTLANPAYQGYLEQLRAYYEAIGLERLDDFRSKARPMSDQPESGVNSGQQEALISAYWSMLEINRLAKNHSWRFEATWVPTQNGIRTQRVAGRLLTVPELAKRPDDGWRLIEFLAGDPANQIFLEQAGRFAMTKSFIQGGSWRKIPGLDFYVESLSQATRLVRRSANPIAGFAQVKWQQAIADVITGNRSSADALGAAQAAIQSELGRLARAGR